MVLVPFAVQNGNIEVNADFLGVKGTHPFDGNYAVAVPSSAAHRGFAALLRDGLDSFVAAGSLLVPKSQQLGEIVLALCAHPWKA